MMGYDIRLKGETPSRAYWNAGLWHGRVAPLSWYKSVWMFYDRRRRWLWEEDSFIMTSYLLPYAKNTLIHTTFHIIYLLCRWASAPTWIKTATWAVHSSSCGSHTSCMSFSIRGAPSVWTCCAQLYCLYRSMGQALFNVFEASAGKGISPKLLG